MSKQNEGGDSQEERSLQEPSGNASIERPIYDTRECDPEVADRNRDRRDFFDQARRFAKAIKIVAVSNGLLAVAAIGTMITGVAQCSFNKAQVEEMRIASQQVERSISATIAASQLDQRAWVGVKHIAMDSFEVGKPLVARVAIANSGKTFAKRMDNRAYLVISKKMFRSGEELRKHAEETAKIPTEGSVVVLAPGAEMSIELRLDEKLVQERFDSISKGERTIHVIGELQYEDIFEKKHVTRFRAFYVPARKVFQSAKDYDDAN